MGDVANGLALAEAAGNAGVLGQEFGRGETGTLGASEFATGGFVAGATGVQAFLDVLALNAGDLGEERDQDGRDVVGGAVFLKGLDSHVLDVEGDAAGVQVFHGLEDLLGVATLPSQELPESVYSRRQPIAINGNTEGGLLNALRQVSDVEKGRMTVLSTPFFLVKISIELDSEVAHKFKKNEAKCSVRRKHQAPSLLRSQGIK